MAATNTVIEFAGRRAEIAAPYVVQAFFATISYRLEPQGRGSRFPVVLMRLYAGQLDPSEMLAAESELDVIGAELRTLPASQAIGSLSSLAPFRAGAPIVNNRAASLFDYFVAVDGTPLVFAFRSVVEQSRVAGMPLAFNSPQGSYNCVIGLVSILIGVTLSVAGYLYFPDYVITAPYSRTPSGPLIWPFGLLLAGIGVVCLFEPRRKPSLAPPKQSHILIATAIAMTLLGLWVAFTWRG